MFAFDDNCLEQLIRLHFCADMVHFGTANPSSTESKIMKTGFETNQAVPVVPKLGGQCGIPL